MRACNCTHTKRVPFPGRVAPATSRTGFSRGTLLPAVSFQLACAVTSARHGEFSANTPSVTVPMLARRRYQRRYPIQKFAGAQTAPVMMATRFCSCIDCLPMTLPTPNSPTPTNCIPEPPAHNNNRSSLPPSNQRNPNPRRITGFATRRPSPPPPAPTPRPHTTRQNLSPRPGYRPAAGQPRSQHPRRSYTRR